MPVADGPRRQVHPLESEIVLKSIHTNAELMNSDQDSQHEADPKASPESREHPERWGTDRQDALWRRAIVLQAGQRRLRNLLGVVTRNNPAVRFTAQTAADKPELLVHKQGGKWKVIANPEARLNVQAVDAGTSEQRRLARWWAQVIQQRERTIVRVAEAIMLGRQKPFLAHGPAKVAPCTMTEAGEDIGIHQTTVSRAVTGKSIQTPHGVFELRFFFGPALRTATGEQTSAQAVRERLKELFSSEDVAVHCSDEKLRKLLEDRYGIVVGRRTIAKYRKKLRVPVSRVRKSCLGPVH